MSRRPGPGGGASFGGEPRLVECPRANSIALSRAGKCSDDSAERRSIGSVLDEVRKPLPIRRGTEDSMGGRRGRGNFVAAI